MLKNARKYPPKLTLAPLVDSRAGQDELAVPSESEFHFEATSTLELFRLKTVHFADEREWPPVQYLRACSWSGTGGYNT